MRALVTPGRPLSGTIQIPGDKSIAHRWLMLAATALGPSSLLEVPSSLDVRSNAACLSVLFPKARPALQQWEGKIGRRAEGHGSTWNKRVEGRFEPAATPPLEVEGDGRRGLVAPRAELDCGNAGTAMRLLAGLVSTGPGTTVLTGDASLRARPMERVAAPLRAMGARIDTTEGHAPVVVHGGMLHGVRWVCDVASAQVKSAVLFAGVDADGTTQISGPAATRDHTERALAALGAPIEISPDGFAVSVTRFQHRGFSASVPGDPSSAAFLVAAAALSGSEITIVDVGLNPSRTRFLDVMDRMGVRTEQTVRRVELGEPVGDLHVRACDGVTSVRVEPSELPLVIDEVPALAALASHAASDSWFLGAGELRVKESDRLEGLAVGIRALGGHAAAEGDDLVVAGGGLEGGVADAHDDHRMAMAFTVAGLAARGAVAIDGIESADVSFPGFVGALTSLGASLESA